MKILVTGANSFTGRALLPFLKSQEVEVYPLSLRGIHFENKTPYLDGQPLATLLRKVAPDRIIHLAGTTAAPSEVEMYAINSGLFLHLVETVAHTLGPIPTLTVGSAAEYGATAEMPLSESAPAKPLTLYGKTKLCQSVIAKKFALEGYPVIIARPFNLIGYGMGEHLALGSFASQLKTIKVSGKKGVLKVGNLNRSRDFIHVKDAVEIYWKLLNQKSAYGEIVNVCRGEAVSIQMLVEVLVKTFQLEVEITTIDERKKKEDILTSFGCARKLYSLIGDYEFRTLQEGIDDLAT